MPKRFEQRDHSRTIHGVASILDRGELHDLGDAHGLLMDVWVITLSRNKPNHGGLQPKIKGAVAITDDVTDAVFYWVREHHHLEHSAILHDLVNGLRRGVGRAMETCICREQSDAI